ncbi:NAD(P)-binding domain-containing protein [Amycolatopsis sp. NPDC059090]|uniref:NAD(P)-binding domain-containing protein n=1 Tax=unclassified Amycolatopsis TaxID=2618356 RepID=UPI00367033A9
MKDPFFVRGQGSPGLPSGVSPPGRAARFHRQRQRLARGVRSRHIAVAAGRRKLRHQTRAAILREGAEMRFSALGTGLMGSAVARALAGAGVPTGAWNRTASRARQLAGQGVTVHADVDSALETSDAVLLTMLDAGSAREVLGERLERAEGKAVVNLMSGTPALARELAQRVTEAGGRYLDGTVQCYPSDIGSAEALVNFSGDSTVWDDCKAALTTVAGGAAYVGEDPGTAAILDAALAGTFYTAGLGAFCEALAFLRDSGIDPTRPEVSLDYWLDLFQAQARSLAAALSKDDYSTADATLAVYLGAARQWHETMLAAGQRGSILAAAIGNLENAAAAGHGDAGFLAQVHTAASA